MLATAGAGGHPEPIPARRSPERLIAVALLAAVAVPFCFAGLPSIPVRYRTGMQAPHPYESRPDEFDWASMGSWYDAFLVSGSRGRGGAELERHAAPVVRAGTWSLWRPRNGLTDRPPSSR